jgi:hypothetical protein
MEFAGPRSEDVVAARLRVVGTLGVVVAVAIAVILGVHPWGSTGLYDDGTRFVDHVGGFWVAIHFVGAMLFLAVPVVLAAWAERFASPTGHVFAKLAATASIVGTALGVLHLAGTDTVTFLAYEDTLASGIDGAVVGADVLLRLHAATLVAFVTTQFVAVPTAAAAAAALDRDWGWRFWLPVTIAALSVTSVSVTVVEGQWTTLSEMGLFRPAVTAFLVWFGLVAYGLRRDGAPRPDPSTPGQAEEAGRYVP